MNIKVVVTDGVAALFQKRHGDKWRQALEFATQELNRNFVQRTGHNVVDYPADDLPIYENDLDGVTVMFRVQGRGVPPHFILRGEWERLVNMPLNRPPVVLLWKDNFMDFDIPDEASE